MDSNPRYRPLHRLFQRKELEQRMLMKCCLSLRWCASARGALALPALSRVFASFCPGIEFVFSIPGVIRSMKSFE